MLIAPIEGLADGDHAIALSSGQRKLSRVAAPCVRQ
jgi:L-aminopeptidase/D-esterase-like protein